MLVIMVSGGNQYIPQGGQTRLLFFSAQIYHFGGTIRSEKIEGIKLGEVTVVSGQYADDLWATLKPTANNIDCFITEIENWNFQGYNLIIKNVLF